MVNNSIFDRKDIEKMFKAVDGLEETQVGSWFLTLLYGIKDLQDQGFRATDVYIQEQKPVSIGILKNFITTTFVPPDAVTQTSIRTVIKKLYTKRLTMLGFPDTEAMKMAEDMIRNENFKSFSVAIHGLGILRITYSKSKNGDVVTMRILPFEVPRLEDVYLPPSYKDFLYSLLKEETIVIPWFNNAQRKLKSVRRGGLIIHSGPTGSGKSTSIAAQIHDIALQTAGMIITYEDPVEYRYITSPNVIQYEIGVEINSEEIYHHFLRSTAQVALFGETRTKEQFLQVIDIASRGHLVYTTLHANSVVEAIMMMRDFAGKENLALLTNSLLAISYQKLVLDQTGKIKTLYEQLMFREDVPEIKQIKQMIEKDETPQSFKNFFIDNAKRLSDLRVYNNYANVSYL